MARMNVKIPFLILFILCALACNPSSQKNDWKKLDVKLTTVLELPDTTDENSEVYFYHPDFVVTDSTGNIIVADKGLNKLFLFSVDGEFLDTFGQRGRGPNEFLQINGMSINESNELFVFDQSSQLVKKFTSSGRYLTSIDYRTSISDVEFEHWQDNVFLFYLIDVPGIVDSNYLLHSFSSNNEPNGEFIPFNDLELLDDDLLISYVSQNGNSHFIDNDTLYFAPSLYNGYIYRYKISKNVSNKIELYLLDKTKGWTFIDKPAESFNGDNRAYFDGVTTMAGGRKIQALFYNLSKGLYQLNNGMIVHFTYIEKKDPHERIFGIEVYDKSMTPIGYAPIKRISFDSKRSNMLPLNVMWKDNQDRFYIIDKENRATPKIRVVSLDGLK